MITNRVTRDSAFLRVRLQQGESHVIDERASLERANMSEKCSKLSGYTHRASGFLSGRCSVSISDGDGDLVEYEITPESEFLDGRTPHTGVFTFTNNEPEEVDFFCFCRRDAKETKFARTLRILSGEAFIFEDLGLAYLVEGSLRTSSGQVIEKETLLHIKTKGVSVEARADCILGYIGEPVE